MKTRSIFAVLLCLVFVSLSLLVPQAYQTTNTTQSVKVLPAFKTHPPGITTLEAYQVKENVTAAQTLQQISTEQFNTGQFVIQKTSQKSVLNTAQITTVQNANHTWINSKAAISDQNNAENLTIDVTQAQQFSITKAQALQKMNTGQFVLQKVEAQITSNGGSNATNREQQANLAYFEEQNTTNTNPAISLNDNTAAINISALTSKFIRTNYVLRV